VSRSELKFDCFCFQLAAFRLQVKQAICYVSDNSLADGEDDEDVIQVVKHIVSERTTFRAKVQVV